MPVLDVGERLNTPSGRLDLAADLIGAMVHPKDKTGRRRRRSALSETLLGMSDRDDEPEAHWLVKGWFRRAGGFKTASESDPYSRQQKDMLRLIPKIITVGTALDLVWAMDGHHRATLPGGASLNKAFAIIRDPMSRFPISETSLQYRHLTACFTCPLKPRCTPDKLKRVKRWKHEGILDAMQARLDRMPDAMLVRRQTVEHPFGTLKAWMGATHFLTWTLDKVRTDEPPRSGLQHKAGDRDHRCGTADGGDQTLIASLKRHPLINQPRLDCHRRETRRVAHLT